MIEDVRDKAKSLRLKTIAEHLPQIMEQAGENNQPCLETIAQLFDLELETRRQNRIALCFRKSKLNETPTIDQFDFNHHSSRKRQKTKILNLIAHYYQSPDLLVIDEIGYLGLGKQGSNLFFQVISQRHETKSTAITTNRPFADWGKIFDSTTVATAIADRLVYNSLIFILEGSSYRKRTKENH